jgi:hypothetical protein
MKLYHFTNHIWLRRIQKEGISRGDVPTSPTEGFNAVWLTSNGDAASQGTMLEKKLSVRLTVEIDSGDPLLKTWLQVMREHRVSGRWRKTLNDLGGGTEAHWYVYLGTVSPDRIVSVDILSPPVAQDLEYMKADAEGRLEAVPGKLPGVVGWRINPA